MLKRIELKNFGPLLNIDWNNLGKINLVIGDNAVGKTFLLKALYSGVRTLEDFKRGEEPRSATDILFEKLFWTFQPEKLGDLVTKGSDEVLSCALIFETGKFDYEFGKDTTKQITTLRNSVPPRTSNSVFLPAKEILSLYHIVLKSREQDKSFGFDDTYLDLVRAIRYSTLQGRNYDKFAESRKSLKQILGGKIEYDEAAGRWFFQKGNFKYPIGVTAEGIKKVAILDTLLGNRYLDPHSIIFIDEPESALHPTALAKFLDIIETLAQCGIQFFLASHSYFVVKKLFLIAAKNQISIPVLSSIDGHWMSADLKDGIPDNPIIDESIRLYKEEVELSLK